MYHTNPNFLRSVRDKYGEVPVNNVRKLTGVKLKRHILGETT